MNKEINVIPFLQFLQTKKQYDKHHTALFHVIRSAVSQPSNIVSPVPPFTLLIDTLFNFFTTVFFTVAFLIDLTLMFLSFKKLEKYTKNFGHSVLSSRLYIKMGIL